MEGDDEVFLATLAKRGTEMTASSAISYDEVLKLISAFSPSNPLSVISKAHIALSGICEGLRRFSNATSSVDAVPNAIFQLCIRALEDKLSEVDEESLLEALSFTSALFAVEHRAASLVFVHEGFQNSLADAVDLFPLSSNVKMAVASTLSLALGHKSCSSALSSRCLAWLESTYQHCADRKLRTTTALSLLKLSQSTGDIDGEKLDEFLLVMRTTVLDHTGQLYELSDAVEGLAYLTSVSSFKPRIVDDKPFVQKLISFHTQLKRSSSVYDKHFGTVPYGLAAIVSNLCSYRPRLTEEEAQIKRLRQLAQPKEGKVGQSYRSEFVEDSPDESSVNVGKRGKELVKLGVTDLLVSIAKVSDSIATRLIVSKAFVDLCEETENRGKILQAGGARALLSLIRASARSSRIGESASSQTSEVNVEFQDLNAMQALAKLSITSSPLQVFGPNENNVVDAIRPLSCLLLHQSSTQLQRFEALMALTNLCSTSPEIASRVGNVEGLSAKVEFLLLEDHILIRRASTELVCNLVSGSEEIFNRYSGELGEEEQSDVASGRRNKAKSILHILVALADVEDEQTRLAASGALAILTGSSATCQILFDLEIENHRIFPILKELIRSKNEVPGEKAGFPPLHTGLVHRGVVCLKNIFFGLTTEPVRGQVAKEAEEQDLVSPLVDILKISASRPSSVPDFIIRPTAEALKWLVDSGIKIKQ